MKVALEKITDKPLRLVETVAAADWDLDSADIKFVDGIELACTFVRLGKEILVDADVTTRMIITCGRCLKEISRAQKHRFQFNYDSAAAGEFLEMDKDIREEILLNFPLRVICADACKGLCAGCGANLNSEPCRCAQPRASAGTPGSVHAGYALHIPDAVATKGKSIKKKKKTRSIGG